MKKENNDLLLVAEDGQSYLVEVSTPKNRFKMDAPDEKEENIERKKE